MARITFVRMNDHERYEAIKEIEDHWRGCGDDPRKIAEDLGLNEDEVRSVIVQYIMDDEEASTGLIEEYTKGVY